MDKKVTTSIRLDPKLADALVELKDKINAENEFGNVSKTDILALGLKKLLKEHGIEFENDQRKVVND